MKYTTLLFDLDDTLLDFGKAEENAITLLFEKYGIPVIDLHHTWMEHLNVGGENYGQGDWLCGVEGDSCHPSDKGHEEIAKNIISVLFSDS